MAAPDVPTPPQGPPPAERRSPWLTVLLVALALGGGLALGALVIGGSDDHTKTTATTRTVTAPASSTGVTVNAPKPETKTTVRTETRTVTVTAPTVETTVP